MSSRPVSLLLEDIWEAAAKVERYTAGLTHDAFLSDERTVDAVVHNLQVIGEAASRIPVGFRQQHPEIEWPGMIGLRHRVVHEYFGADLELVWQIVQVDLVRLMGALAHLRPASEG